MGPSPNVLIVEDHDNLRNILATHLTQHGYHVKGTPDAEGIQSLMASQSFDVVVLDLNLPDEDGLSVAKRLRRSHPNIFIIMMTARNSSAEKVAGYQSGADVYITKPSLGDELIAAVNSWRRRTYLNETPSGLRLNLQRRELIGTEKVSLGGAETMILHAMCLASNYRVEYFRLIELLDLDVDAKGKASLEVHIARLRKKLMQVGCAKPAIKAIRNEGYQLVEPVTVQ